MLARLAELQPQVNEMGVQVAAVTMGEPEEATEFCGPRAPGVLCLSDTGQMAYRTYGLGQAGLLEAMGPGVWKESLNLLAGGHLGGVPMGDVRQMPGTFVIDRDGRVHMAYYSRSIGDHPKPAEIIEVLRQTAGVAITMG